MTKTDLIDKTHTDILNMMSDSPLIKNDITNKDTLNIILDLFLSHGMLPPRAPIKQGNSIVVGYDYFWENK